MRGTSWRHTFQVSILLAILFVLLYTGLHFSNVSAIGSQNVISNYGMIRNTRMIVGVDYWSGFTAASFTSRDLWFLQDAGIEILRLEFGSWSEDNLANLVPSVTANGIEVLGLLMRKDLVGNIDAWGDWVYDTVLAHKEKVKVWEIWNEPNWGTGFQDNPAGYTEFLKRAYTRAKEADPDCIILGGSLLGTHDEPINYLTSMYDNGAKNYMDAVSVHPYCSPAPPKYPHTNSWSMGFWKLQRVRDLMIERGDEDEKIWITEMGWPTPLGTNGVSEEEQADYLARALAMALDWGWVETFIIYNWMDGKSANLYFGLAREKYSPPYTPENFCKPSFFAVKDFISNSTKTT